MSLYLNTYQLRSTAQIRNVTNSTSDPKVRVCQLCNTEKISTIGWLNLWKNATGDYSPSCAATNCANSANVGAHIAFSQAGNTPGTGSNRVFICPLCTSCNNQHNAQFSIRANTFLIHLGLFMEDLLPDEYELANDYENSMEKQLGQSLRDYVNTKTATFVQNQKNRARIQSTLDRNDASHLLGPYYQADNNLAAYAQSLN